LNLSAQGAGAGTGGNVIINQSSSNIAQALSVGTTSNLTINVNGGATGSGGLISITAPAGISIPGQLSTSLTNPPTGTINLNVLGPGSISQKGTLISTG